MIFYFCGAGAIARSEGTPSAERHRMLRREALELALYTSATSTG